MKFNTLSSYVFSTVMLDEISFFELLLELINVPLNLNHYEI